MQVGSVRWGTNGFRLPHVITVGLLLMVSGFWFLASADVVHACKCAVPGTPTEEFEESAAVFAGRVVSIEHSFDPDTLPRTPEDRTTVGFEVSSVWKGDIEETTYVTTPPTGGSCGFTFTEGEEYFVYAHESSFDISGYTVSLCSRTVLLADAGEDIEALGEGEVPQSGTEGIAPEQTGDTSFNWPLVVGLVVAVVAIAGALVYALLPPRGAAGQ